MINTWIKGNKLYINTDDDLGDVKLVISTNNTVIYGKDNINIKNGINYWFSPENSLVKYHKILLEIYKGGSSIYQKEILSNEKLGKNKNNAISIILSYANTVKTKTLLSKCLGSIDGDKLLMSHCPIDIEHQNMTNYSIYKSDNPLLLQKDFDKFGVDLYFWEIVNGKRISKRCEFDHKYAVYSLIQTGINFAKSLGYEIVHIINYDYELKDEILKSNFDLLNSNHDLVFYSNTGWGPNAYLTGFFSGKINSLLKYFNLHHTLDSFYNHENSKLLEEHVYNYFNSIDVKIKEIDINTLKDNAKLDQIGVFSYYR